jgi:hypothetical protein
MKTIKVSKQTYFFILFSFIFLLKHSECFEIRIEPAQDPISDDGPFGDNMINPLEIIGNQIINEIGNELLLQEAELEKAGKKAQKLHKLPKLKVHKGKKHKEIIKTFGPGFETVQVKEFFDNPMDSNIEVNPFENPIQIMSNPFENDLRKEDFSSLIKSEPVELPFMNNSIPMIFVKTTRKNLKRNDDLNAKNPMKIFSALDKMFDNFFDINTIPRLSSENSDSGMKVIDVRDATPAKLIEKLEKEKELSDKAVPSTYVKDDMFEKIINGGIDTMEKPYNNVIHVISTPPSQVKVNTDIENKKTEPTPVKVQQNELQKLEKDLMNKPIQEGKISTNMIDDTARILFAENSLINNKSQIIKYAIYITMFLILIFGLFCLFMKITQKEDSLEYRHSINELEDELKGMKEKSKIF